MKRLTALLLGVGLAAGVACYGSYATYDPYYYDYAYYDPYYYYYDSVYTYYWYDPFYGSFYYNAPQGGTTKAVDVNMLAAQIAQRAATDYTPSGCATAVASGGTVQYAFNGCDSTFGIHNVSGHITLTLSSASANQVSLAAKSDGLTINGDPYNMDFTSVATKAGDQHSVNISSRSFAPNRFDSRQANSTISWTAGSRCLAVDGSGSSTKGNLAASNVLTNYNKCVGQCASSGTLTVQAPSGTFTTTFDGSGTATVQAPNGTTKQYNLTCD